MSESTAKAQLDPEVGEGVSGYITPSDIQDAIGIIYDDFEAGDALRLSLGGGTLSGSLAGTSLSLSSTLAVTGNTTLTGTLNGKIVNDLVTGPVSATDNALVRFDGTGGKTVQNSGITVDDSGNVSSDLTVSKASPTLRVNATSGDSVVTIDGAAGSLRSVRFRTGTALRWFFGASSGAETGSEAGSDFRLRRYNDAAAGVSDPLYVWRNTGKITFGDVGASAGLELGSSGPRVMSGTGSPEGVVTAPVGSMWLDTAATTGAIRWIKASGTGNTGWVVEYGDTGRRSMNAAALSSDADYTINSCYVQRVGKVVEFFAEVVVGAGYSTGDVLWTVQTGFRPSLSTYGVLTSYTPTTGILARYNGVNLLIYSATATTHRLRGTWLTNDAWPTSLPGSAA